MFAREKAIVKQQAALRLAEKEYIPDFTFGLQYRLRWVEQRDAVAGADFIGFTVGINLPIYFFRKQRERVYEVKSSMLTEKNNMASTWDQIREQIGKTLLDIDRDRTQAKLYRQKIIPDTQSVLDSSLADYQAGRLGFITVLDNLMSLFRAQVDLARRTTQIQASRARLEYWTGKPLGRK